MNPLHIPKGFGPFHFIGIGGIGMSGLAEVLLAQGFAVQGSDQGAGPMTERLAARGARVFLGHEAAQVRGAGVVVVSTAIREGNPELVAARAGGLPVIHRADLLAEVMKTGPSVAVAGTHGKTTTTTMVAALLEAAGVAPTVVNGGVIHAYGSNARVGDGDWVVAEADESDGSFNRLPVTVAVVTNIDPEHLEHWGSFEKLRDGFRRFARSIPFHGRAVLCIDHPEVARLAGELSDKMVTTYGLRPGADLGVSGLRFENGKSRFDILVRHSSGDRKIEGCELPVPGTHNVSNALAAVGVALHFGVDDATIRSALAEYQGVGRRFTRVGEAHGVTVIDDYGHHPVEIAATLQAARQSVGSGARVIAVHQPHRFTRLASLFDDFATCFDGADAVGLLPVYPAGEDPIPGATTEALIAAMAARGRPAQLLSAEADLAALVRNVAQPGDIVVCLGAGTISAWAKGLPARLLAG
jgi:UDP-N-acetylmuramate--alanine ligase